MKKLSWKAAVGLLAFIIGVASIFLWFEVSQPEVTLCQLAQNPEYYDGKTITVEADGHSYNGRISISVSDCYITHSSASIQLAESYKPSGEEETFYQKSKTEFRTARILVTGRFKSLGIINCHTPRAAIVATNVQIKSAIITETIQPIGNSPEETNPEETSSSEHFTICYTPNKSSKRHVQS